MAGAGVNLAITKDGGSYNKLQRPQDYLTSAITPPPPRRTLLTEAPPAKRKHEHTGVLSANKRIRAESEFGMRTCLPGSDDEEHSADDSIGEALAYLRDVRSEALAIPHLLVGSTAANAHVNARDPTVLFRDGTWIALNEQNVTSHDEDFLGKVICNPHPQDRVYQLLLKRFHNLRNTLASAMEKKHAHTTRTSCTAVVKRGNTQSARAWLDIMDKTYPNVSELSKLDEAAVYERLQHCADSIDLAASISSNVSCWIWSLLALVGDAGTLDNEKISKIRYLGQRVGALGARLQETNLQCQLFGEDSSATPSIITNPSAGGSKPGTDDNEGILESEHRHHNTLNHEHKNKDIKPTQTEPLSRKTVVQDKTTNSYLSLIESNESDAEMSMSGDEDQEHSITESSEIERARARLLEQLGDRLVHTQLPPQRSPSEPTERKGHSRPEMKQDSGSKTLQDRIDHQRNSVALGDRMWGGSAEDCTTLNTRATIDMVLTIVVECFGQRDLLRYRQHW